MRYQLNPRIETFFLLLNPDWGKEQKKEAIKKLDEFGINGRAFYQKHFSLIERYHAAFAGRMIKTSGTMIFEDMCEELVFVFTDILLLCPEWLSDFSAVSEEDAGMVVKRVIIDALEDDSEVITALEASGISDQAKWQIAALLQQPRQRLKLVFDAVSANLHAFEYAYGSLEEELTPLLVQLEEHVVKGNLPAALQQSLELNPDAHVIPSLAAALGFMVFDEYCVIGLLANKLFADEDEGFSKHEAILVAKSLSDTSKMDILLALKHDSLYNLEIANLLELTPATTSHHMNMLLAAGLVEVSKKDGKVYYSLSADGLMRYRDWLSESLINPN